MYPNAIFVGFALVSTTVAQTPYGLTWNFNSSNFFDNFNFVEAPDSAFTNGFAKYVSQDKAESNGLATIADSKVRLGVDTTNNYAASSTGRESVRLQSRESFDNGLLVADFAHIPVSGCGMWPAFWIYQGETSSSYSEIDIIENVNGESRNSHSFYTSEKCTVNRVIPDVSERTEDCTYDREPGQGCSYMAHEGTFNQGFNDNYSIVATQIESDGIKIWYFNEDEVPEDLRWDNPAPQDWSVEPSLHITPDDCDFDRAWRLFHIVINITFCGGWAGDIGGVWNNPGTLGEKSCAAQTGQVSCKAWVGENPGDFEDTYFEFNSIKLFQRS
ncbi:glycoside hydrolase family 16 protein [Periconia macrospinosa]|uniref:Glycoside hydrolase family 16 protein n=1 Tax=Periconia macrospinosa TaxID=97972 RepID=A0A2V1DCG9_9PLEO|nr:glycoside hydrolase family 16 protein [Periconia macrospinosa]